MPRIERDPPIAHWERPSALIVLSALGAAVVVHALTFAGVDATLEYPWLWGLHVVALGAFVAMILHLNRRGAGASLDSRIPPANWPAWASNLMVAAFVYALLNFVLFIALHGSHGNPAIRDGVYVLRNHGHVVRTLTASEYRWARAWQVRGFSGHWMVFLLAPALYFLFAEERRADTYFRIEG